MPKEIQLGDENVRIGDFSAYKAIKAMEIVADVEGAWRQVMGEAAVYKAEYEAQNVVEIDRAEARRQFRPIALYRTRHDEHDGDVTISEEPVLDEHGAAVLGPDPLGHLTEEDWQASGNRLRISDSPSQNMQITAMVPRAFGLAREHVLRLLALAITPNRKLEEWDGEQDVNAELDTAGRALLHQAKADELVLLAVLVLEVCKEQLAGPFDEAANAYQRLFPAKTAEPEVQPMTMETEPSSSEPTSSTDSPPDTDGSPRSSSTASASVS